MDSLIFPADGGPVNFSGADWALILAGAALLRVLPLLMLVGAVLKLRRFPDLRALHLNLLVSALLVVTLGLIDTVYPALIPLPVRTTGAWSFLWIFAIAWLGVTWTRSALKTGLRPRWIEIATLSCAATLALAASGLILPISGVG